MTPSEINLRIAKLCGWTEYHSEHRNEIRWRDPEGHNWLKPPDYYNDLNACAVFEHAMTRQELERYLDIFELFNQDPLSDILATPARRCQVFLSMHNQWSDV